MEYALLAALGVGVWKATELPSNYQQLDDLATQSKNDAGSGAGMQSQFALEDRLYGQLQKGLAGLISVDTGGFASGYVPNGRAPMGSSLNNAVNINSKNMASYQTARYKNAFRTRTASVDQGNNHHPVQLMASLTDRSVWANPRAVDYPFRYDEQRTMVNDSELGAGSARRPDPLYTGTPETFANNNLQIEFTKQRTVNMVNPFARRGNYAQLAQGGKPSKNFTPTNRTPVAVGVAPNTSTSVTARV